MAVDLPFPFRCLQRVFFEWRSSRLPGSSWMRRLRSPRASSKRLRILREPETQNSTLISTLKSVISKFFSVLDSFQFISIHTPRGTFSLSSHSEQLALLYLVVGQLRNDGRVLWCYPPSIQESEAVHKHCQTSAHFSFPEVSIHSYTMHIYACWAICHKHVIFQHTIQYTVTVYIYITYKIMSISILSVGIACKLGEVVCNMWMQLCRSFSTSKTLLACSMARSQLLCLMLASPGFKKKKRPKTVKAELDPSRLEPLVKRTCLLLNHSESINGMSREENKNAASSRIC